MLVPGMLAALAFVAARAYSGLMLLDRSRAAGALALLVVSIQVVNTLKEAPFVSVSTALALVSFILVISIWKELDGPLPFGLQSSQQVFLGITILSLIHALTPHRDFLRSSSDDEERRRMAWIRPAPYNEGAVEYQEWAETAEKDVPGFAGLFTSWTIKGSERECVVLIMLTNPATHSQRATTKFAAARARTANGVPPQCEKNSSIKIEEARFNFAQLNEWYDLLHQENWRLQTKRSRAGSTTRLSIDVRQNMIRVDPGEPGDFARLRSFGDSVGIPKTAMGMIREVGFRLH